jgi:hypothetical protein
MIGIEFKQVSKQSLGNLGGREDPAESLSASGAPWVEHDA